MKRQSFNQDLLGSRDFEIICKWRIDAQALYFKSVFEIKLFEAQSRTTIHVSPALRFNLFCVIVVQNRTEIIKKVFSLQSGLVKFRPLMALP